nr:hypothetical protein Itr_chr04CG04970 [Ipomoea trifida]
MISKSNTGSSSSSLTWLVSSLGMIFEDSLPLCFSKPKYRQEAIASEPIVNTPSRAEDIVQFSGLLHVLKGVVGVDRFSSKSYCYLVPQSPLECFDFEDEKKKSPGMDPMDFSTISTPSLYQYYSHHHCQVSFPPQEYRRYHQSFAIKCFHLSHLSSPNSRCPGAEQ